MLNTDGRVKNMATGENCGQNSQESSSFSLTYNGAREFTIK
jgi:hypothetical protein